jgi:transposase-like protein
MTRAEHGRSVQRELIDAGLRPDDAVVAAEVFDRIYREKRDAAVRAVREAGLSVRKVAKLFGISHVRVIQISSQR